MPALVKWELISMLLEGWIESFVEHRIVQCIIWDSLVIKLSSAIVIMRWEPKMLSNNRVYIWKMHVHNVCESVKTGLPRMILHFSVSCIIIMRWELYIMIQPVRMTRVIQIIHFYILHCSPFLCDCWLSPNQMWWVWEHSGYHSRPVPHPAASSGGGEEGKGGCHWRVWARWVVVDSECCEHNVWTLSHEHMHD